MDGQLILHDFIFAVIVVIMLAALLICGIICLFYLIRLHREAAQTKDAVRALLERPLTTPIIAVPANIRHDEYKTPASPPAYTPPPAVSSIPAAETAPVGSDIRTPSAPAEYDGGDVKLINVPEKTAAMLMAMLADKLRLPPDELRFVSIKDITED
ncbi:MAG: hypothetical protein GXY20_00350 [Clostridiales bacterium]|nr:hypothetical protein [Clostridiales bacterium]